MVAMCALLAGCAAPAPRASGGIVSTNPCADAMLVELAPERLRAISAYSKDAATSSIAPEVAARFRGTRGGAEEVIAMRPDLVIASSFTAPSTRTAYDRAGLNVVYLGSPTSIAASTAQVRELAAAVNARGRGEAMAARIERSVEAARTDAAPVPALLWIGGNLVSGGGNLLDDMLVRAGFSDHAAHYGLQYTGYLPVEIVAADPPRVMLVPDPPGRSAESRAAQVRARILSHRAEPVAQAHFPRNLINCGGPVIPRAMARLAQIRRSLP